MNDGSSSEEAHIRVLKRGGAIERFELAKLRGSIGRALHAGGDPTGFDASVAGGLAEAIRSYLADVPGQEPVPAKDLLGLVEIVLTQTGHSAAGMALRQHAQLRERQRRWQMVVGIRQRDGRLVQKRWSKRRLVESLQREHSLDAPASRMIAGRVEQLVFNCGLKVVTSGLVRELANSELLAWGLLPEALLVKEVAKHRAT